MPVGNSILMTADSIIDIDIGLIKYVSKNFTNTLVNNHVHKSMDSFFYDFLLNSALDENVLNGMVLDNKKLSKKQIDEYYRLFLLEKYDEIVKESPLIDSTARLLNAYIISSLSTGINITILCKTETEKDIIMEINNTANCLICPDSELNSLNIDPYTRFIFRSIKTISKIGLDKFMGKDFLILGYRYNFDKDNDKRLLSEISHISDINKFEIIIPYEDYESPLG